MKLSKRLQAIYDMVPGGILADVGSDHGKLVISLFENGVISKGYAIENKEGPYKRLVANIKKHHLLDDVIPMFSDGISELPSDVDVVVIAGMGGHLIINILESHPEKLTNVKSIVVDAHNSVDKVRKSIVSLGYFIKDEKVVFEDDIYYEIIRFDKGESKSLDELDYEFGPILRREKSDLFRQKYQTMLVDLKTLLSKDNLPQTRRDEINRQIERLESVLWTPDECY